MIDIHTHILYNIDDGSDSLENSLDLVRAEIDNDVDKIVFTPHFNPFTDSIDSFLEKREEGFNVLSEAVASLNLNVGLYSGCEIFYSQIIYYFNSLKPFCFSNKKYLLVEFPSAFRFDNEFFSLFYKLIEKFDVNPIIAHVENYDYIRKHYKILRKFIDLDCMIQVNADNFIKNFNDKFFKKIFNNNLADIIASDCHNLVKRPPKLKEAMNLVKDVYGNDYYEKILENQNKIKKTL